MKKTVCRLLVNGVILVVTGQNEAMSRASLCMCNVNILVYDVINVH